MSNPAPCDPDPGQLPVRGSWLSVCSTCTGGAQLIPGDMAASVASRRFTSRQERDPCDLNSLAQRAFPAAHGDMVSVKGRCSTGKTFLCTCVDTVDTHKRTQTHCLVPFASHEVLKEIRNQLFYQRCHFLTCMSGG